MEAISLMQYIIMEKHSNQIDIPWWNKENPVETTRKAVICKYSFSFKKTKFILCVKQQFDIIIYTVKSGLFAFKLLSFFTVLFIHTYVNSSHTFIVFLILNSWETDL